MLKLKELREGRGLSQRELARQLNVAPATYNNWELGKRDPDIDTIRKIAEYYQVSTDYLMGSEQPTEDDDLTEYLEQLRNHPELKVMFSLTSKATKEDIDKLVAIAQTLFGDKN